MLCSLFTKCVKKTIVFFTFFMKNDSITIGDDMKKLRYLGIVLLGMFLFTPGVFADESKDGGGFSIIPSDVTICSVECDYTTLDSFLSDVEDGAFEVDYVHARILDECVQISSSHTISKNIYLSFEKNTGTLQGNNVVLTTSGSIAIGGRNLEITDLTIVSTQTGIEPYVLELNAENVHLNHLYLSYTGERACGALNYGIINNSNNFSIENSTIENFGSAIICGRSTPPAIDNDFDDVTNDYSIFPKDLIVGNDESSNGNMSIDSCILNNNDLSAVILDSFYSSISNSKLTSCFLLGDFTIEENNEMGDMVLKYVDLGARMEEPIYCTEGPFIYSSLQEPIEHSPGYIPTTIHLSKKISVDLNHTKEIQDMLKYFRDESSKENFTFEILPGGREGVATVDNGKISILRTGDVSIQATNDSTHETYTLHLHVSQPVINPSTGSFRILLFFGVLILSLGIGSFAYKKAHK